MIKEKLLPMQELKMFGVYRDGKFTIPEDQVKALREGRMTDVVELKNLKGKDVQIDSLPARLSIVRGADGNPSLRVDPVYRSPNTHPRLSEDEKKQLIDGEVANVRKEYMARDGKLRTEIIEFDPTTKQFMSFDPRSIQAPERVNCQKLMDWQQKKFKEGEVVELEDGTQFQVSTTDKKGIRSNRNGLVLSVILDGGISFLLVTGIKRMLGGKSSEEKSYSEGFKDGLLMVQKNAERKLAMSPGDKDAVKELNMARQELSKVAALPDNYHNRDADEAKRLTSTDARDGRNHGNTPDEDGHRQRRI